MRNMSSRNGTATLTLPKNVTSPVSASNGYCMIGTEASENQPANSTKLIESSLPVCGKLNDAGTMTSGSCCCDSSTPALATSVRLDSMSTGSTMKRSPATKAVIRPLRVSAKISRARIGVSAATSPGSTQRLTSSDTPTYEIRNTCRRPSCSRLSVPAAVAAMANSPYGVSWTMNLVARESAALATCSRSSRYCLAVEANHRDAEDDGKQHHRRDDVVGERVERIRGNVEIDEVERRPPLDERRAEECRRFRVRKGQRHEHRVEETDQPERHEHGARAQAEPAGFGAPQ